MNTGIMIVAGLALLAMVGMFAIILIPNRGISVERFAPMTDAGLLRGIIGGI